MINTSEIAKSDLKMRNFNPLWILFTIIVVALLINSACNNPIQQTEVENTIPTRTGEYSEVLYFSQFYDSTKTDSENLQAMFDFPSKFDKRVTFNLEGRHFMLDTTVYYHKVSERITLILGDNARIEAPKGSTFDLIAPDVGFGFIASDGSNPNDIASYMDQIMVRDIRFSNGRNQLIIAGSLQSSIKNCQFWRAHRGILNVFGLQTIVEECRFQNQIVEGVVFRSGMSDLNFLNNNGAPSSKIDGQYFTNATGSNSQSNRSVIRDCRFYGGSGQISCVRVSASDGIMIDNCIFEGNATRYSVHNDNRGSTTTKSITILRPHLEHGHPSATKALIYNRGCNLIVDQMYQQYGDVVMIHSDGGSVELNNIRWWKPGPNTLISNSCDWYIEAEADTSIPFLSDPETWGGSIPLLVKLKSKTSEYYIGRTGGGTFLSRGGSGIALGSYNQESGFIDFSNAKNTSSQMIHDFSRVVDLRNVATKIDSIHYGIGSYKAKGEDGEDHLYQQVFIKK